MWIKKSKDDLALRDIPAEEAEKQKDLQTIRNMKEYVQQLDMEMKLIMNTVLELEAKYDVHD